MLLRSVSGLPLLRFAFAFVFVFAFAFAFVLVLVLQTAAQTAHRSGTALNKS